MQPHYLTKTLTAGSANNISLSQSPGAGAILYHYAGDVVNPVFMVQLVMYALVAGLFLRGGGHRRRQARKNTIIMAAVIACRLRRQSAKGPFPWGCVALQGLCEPGPPRRRLSCALQAY